jgi:hypothetical protein
VHPRIGQFVELAIGLARHDCIAPVAGTVNYLGQVDPAGGAAPVGAGEPSSGPSGHANQWHSPSGAS